MAYILCHIRSLPKSGTRKSRNVNQRKKTAAILTDTFLKNPFKKTTIHVFEQITKTGVKKRGKISVWTISSERFTKGAPKNKEIE